MGEMVADAVTRLPAYINNSKCQTMINPGKISDSNVLRIINEATGAAIVYSLGNKAGRRCEWRRRRDDEDN